jgi:gentisate 1,2-dioxygenase
MTTTFQATQALFRLGHHARIVAEHGSYARLRHTIAPEHRILLAHALFHTGETESARAIVQDENHPHAPISLRSHCELISGLIQRRAGEIASSHKHFEAALRLAREAKDYGRAAWAALQRFRTLAETQPGDQTLGATMTDVRHLAALAADPHLDVSRRQGDT